MWFMFRQMFLKGLITAAVNHEMIFFNLCFLLRLNNLSFLGFLRNACMDLISYMRVIFFGREHHDFLICTQELSATSALDWEIRI